MENTEEIYTDFARVYDELMDNTPYEMWCNRLDQLIASYGVSRPTRDAEGILDSERNLVVDLGCGTGTLTEMLYQKGYDCIGLDNSEEMLNIAMDKKAESGSEILYLHQDMRELDLYSTVGTVISVCDSVNYILEEEELLQVSTMGLFTTVIKVICAAAAGLIAVRRCKKRLWLYGALAGTLYAVLAFIVFSAVAGTLYVSIALLSDIAIGAVSGLLSVMVLQMLK